MHTERSQNFQNAIRWSKNVLRIFIQTVFWCIPALVWLGFKCCYISLVIRWDVKARVPWFWWSAGAEPCRRSCNRWRRPESDKSNIPRACLQLCRRHYRTSAAVAPFYFLQKDRLVLTAGNLQDCARALRLWRLWTSDTFSSAVCRCSLRLFGS